MPFKICHVHDTPNPNAKKFLLDRQISLHTVSFLNPEQGKEHPIASQLFEIKGVKSVMLLNDFITINKAPSVKWDAIERAIKEIVENLGD